MRGKVFFSNIRQYELKKHFIQEEQNAFNYSLGAPERIVCTLTLRGRYMLYIV